MCLDILRGSKIEIAKEPIAAIKVVNPYKSFLWIKLYRSYFRDTLHRFNRVIRGTRHLKVSKSNVSCFEGRISRGIHAYKFGYINPDSETRYCVIPVGAEYCYGDRNDIVANKMIVFSDEKRFKEYINKKSK